MKRFLILFMFLGVLYSGAWAQKTYNRGVQVTTVDGLVAGDYIIHSSNSVGSGYWNKYDDGTNVLFTAHGDNDSFEEKYVWSLERSGSTITLKNKSANQYITMCSNNGGSPMQLGSDYAASFTPASTGYENGFSLSHRTTRVSSSSTWYVHSAGTTGNNPNYGIPFDKGMALNYWTSSINGLNSGTACNIKFYKAEEIKTDIAITITYQTSNNSWTVNRTATDGATLNANNYAVDFYKNFAFAAGTNTTVSETNKNFTITCEEDFPFEVGKLCRIQSRGDSHQNMDFYDGNGSPLYGASGYGANKNLWVFKHVENTPDLFTVKNFATGKYLTFQDGTRKKGELRTDIVNDGAHTSYLRVRKSTYDNRPENAFCLQHPTVVACCYGPHINSISVDGLSNGLGGWAAGSETDALKNDQNCLISLAPNTFTATLNKVGDEFYGTIYMPYDMTLPGYVEAYKASADGAILRLVKVGGSTTSGDTPQIAAGAYILYCKEIGSTATQKEKKFTLSDATLPKESNNILTGSIIVGETLPEGSNYVLNNGSKGVGFYKYNQATYPTAKAVYSAGTQSAVSAFIFDFGSDPLVTAIESLKTADTEQQSIYDLQGRRIQKAVKGLNIINGQKVIR